MFFLPKLLQSSIYPWIMKGFVSLIDLHLELRKYFCTTRNWISLFEIWALVSFCLVVKCLVIMVVKISMLLWDWNGGVILIPAYSFMLGSCSDILFSRIIVMILQSYWTHRSHKIQMNELPNILKDHTKPWRWQLKTDGRWEIQILVAACLLWPWLLMKVAFGPIFLYYTRFYVSCSNIGF